MAFTVYHNPRDIALAGEPIAGVESVVVSCQQKEFRASGDGDLHESVARFTAGRTSGTITLLDAAAAASLAGRSGTLSFTWTDVKAEADKTVTIASAWVGGYDAAVSRESAGKVSLAFVAEAAPVIVGAV